MAVKLQDVRFVRRLDKPAATTLGHILNNEGSLDALPSIFPKLDPVVALQVYHATQGRGTPDLYRGIGAIFSSLFPICGARRIADALDTVSTADPSDAILAVDALFRNLDPRDLQTAKDRARRALACVLPTLPRRRTPR